MNNIQLLKPIPPVTPGHVPEVKSGQVSESKSTPSFSDFLKDAVAGVNDAQLYSAEMNNLMTLGKIDNLHEVPIASEKASIAMQLTVAIRNKVVEAYSEVMRMQA